MATRKGFPIQLSRFHWLMVAMAYSWLKENGLATDQMTKIAHKIPVKVPSEGNMSEAASGSYMNYGGDSYNHKVVRFRGDEVDGAIQLLSAAGMLTYRNQIGSTIMDRANKLRAIGHLDLIADAARR